MLDALDLVCPVLRDPWVAPMMRVFGNLGHPGIGIAMGLALLGHGYFYKSDRTRQAGFAVLSAVILAVGATEALKQTLPLSRAALPGEYGLPSRQTSAAFALASALSVTFPGLGPIFFVCATLIGIARIYLSAQYIWSMIGGALIGVALGLATAMKLIRRPITARRESFNFFAWAGASAFGLAALAFFYSAERNIGAHLLANATAADSTAAITLDFGTPLARQALRYGWSGDESWEGGKRSVVWAQGLASEFILNLPSEQDYRFRFNVFPFFPAVPACQQVEVRVNGLIAAKVSLEKGWHWYQFDVPKAAVHQGRNFVQFFYNYAETPKSRGHSSDDRQLSVAIDILQAFPKS